MSKNTNPNPIESITRKGVQFHVKTRTFMSDGTFQEGTCDRDGAILRFRGWMNRMPFRVNLSPVNLALILDLRDGETVYFNQ